MLGENITVRSASLHIDEATGVDLWGAAHLSASSGVDCLVGFGFHNHYQCVLELWGSEGMLSTDRVFTAPPHLETTVRLNNGKGHSEHKVAPFNSYAASLTRFSDLINEAASETADWSDELRLNVAQSALLSNCQEKAAETR